MIFITKIIAEELVDKLPLDKIKRMLPSIPDVCITYCATKKERKEDKWLKDGKTFYRIVLDYNMVATNSIDDILLEIKKITLAKLKA